MTGKVYRSIYPDINVPTDVSLHQFLCARNPDDVPDNKVILEDLSPPRRSLHTAGFDEMQQLLLVVCPASMEYELGMPWLCLRKIVLTTHCLPTRLCGLGVS